MSDPDGKVIARYDSLRIVKRDEIYMELIIPENQGIYGALKTIQHTLEGHEKPEHKGMT